MVKGLVFMENEKALTTTLIIAKGMNLEHRAVVKLLKKYSGRKILSDIPVRKLKTKGRNTTYFLLNEKQTTFLISLMMNSEKVIEFKEKLVGAFFRQRELINQLILQRQNPDWQNIRKDGKQVYFQKTDVIKNFVEYATAQGSKSAKMYYMNLAKMENKALFFFEQKYKNMREVMTIKQLMQVSTADGVIEKALTEGMEQELEYKEIFKLAKKRIIAYAEIIGQSPILKLTTGE